jgi:hypothetical protein
MVDKNKLREWSEAKASLDHYKKHEGKLRREICEEMFEGKTGKFTCTETIDGDVLVTAKSVTNLTADEEMLLQLHTDGFLTPEDDLCFERKLKIKDSDLRKRPATSNVWKAITEKPGMPKLEVTMHGD